jgi:hypothetical protein
MGGKLSWCYASCTYQSNHQFYRTPYAIIDDEKHIIAVLTRGLFPKNGVPDDWDDVVVHAGAAIEAAHEEMHFREDNYDHRRGPFVAKPFGWSYGIGHHVSIYNLFCYLFLTTLLM